MTDGYAARAARHAAARDVEHRRSTLIARARLATFLSAAGVFIWGLSHTATPGLMGLSGGLFVVFGALVVWHARVDERVAWYDALRQVNDWALARVERRWDALPRADAPGGVDLARHPYAVDLDLFGRASLFQWLGPAATSGGAGTLARWLLSAASPDEIRARQAAVSELARASEWREAFAAHGVVAGPTRQEEIDVFLTWVEAAPHPSLRTLHLLTWACTLSIWILLGLSIAGILDTAFWLLPFVIGVTASVALAKAISDVFDRAGIGQRALGRYAGLLGHVTSLTTTAPWLRACQARLTAHGADAPACMRRLGRILDFASLRTGAALLHFPIQALTLWDFHVFFALERWRQDVGRHVREWFGAVGDLDALTELAGARFDHPDWCLPEIDADARYVAASLGHPLLPNDRRGVYDVTVGPRGTLLLVTGSNMSGKSTLLRAIGLNAVLAQAGSAVCATSLRIPACDLQTSIRVTDSLELGLSYFMAALARLKGVVDAAERPREGRVLLYLLDEILQGTNSAERETAVLAVARHLLDSGAIGAMTTHDLSLASREPIASAARLVHFTETLDADGSMRFDYRLLDGIATSRNALRLMTLIGIEP